MRATYYDGDDILVVRISSKPVHREVSQNWCTHISYAEDGTMLDCCARCEGKRGISIGDRTRQCGLA